MNDSATTDPITERFTHTPEETCLVDTTRLQRCDVVWFTPDLLAARGLLTGSGTGRRPVHFIRHEDEHWVLRHYWRGGLMARLSSDAYLRTGVQRARPIREWRLLSTLYQRGLPVPRPIAARVRYSGLTWKGDLITEVIPHACTLFELIQQCNDPPAIWEAVGRTLARFHQAGAWHADLNVRNILVQPNNAVWLIDWDRGRMNTTRGLKRNLSRLQRSLEKWPETRERGRAGWPDLMRAYRKAQGGQDG
ncbi:MULTISPECIES: 3-deoxy-D-manno-octulosonic acid kinase [unclassified Thioalkalivibrio]|uniref:3-deoxy-D-manno-octulosonic acid kinase n=1 Tax=unclassified Thioalkalivibrio TaxID=2621013 RepID=UPI000374AC48|nr:MULTISPECIES: 3-deoxy-D-manno-octulosonic acid kinase [unclassified Thioalkalivibrio]